MMKTRNYQTRMFGRSRLRDVGSYFGSNGVVAAFTGTPTSGGDPTEVTFTSTSTGTITDYLYEKRLLPGDWASFDGDGAVENPVEVFTGIGGWDVRLTVTGPGGSNTQTRLAYISIIS